MHTLTSWFTKNPVAANLLMLLVLLAGFFTLKSIRIEGFPALPPRAVMVTTVYPGASAEQVDRGISRRIEKALEGMPGIKRLVASSMEGFSSLWIQKKSGFDLDRFQNEIKTRVDTIYNLPQQAERPIVTRDEFNVEALVVQVYGDTDEHTLQKVARDVKEELLAHPDITRLNFFGQRPYEIRVEVDNDKLRACGLSLNEVALAIDRASLDYRTGSIKSEAGKVILRADRRAFNYEEFAAMPLVTRNDGSRVLIRDVADVIDGFHDETFLARYQHQPSVGMQVYTSKQGSLFEVSKAAHAVVDRLRPQLPEGLYVDIWGEYSIYMKDRLNLLASNAWQGLFIVFVLLALFLNVKLAFWVAMGIPISLAGTLALMGPRFLDYSLNDITTFGMIVVLGILVDDAIVVGESVFDTRNHMANPLEGTIQGVHRVATATVFGCFTTVAAFFPLLLIDNELGKLFASFSVVVIVSLLVSLLESKLVLPAHLAHVSIAPSQQLGWLSRTWGRLQGLCAHLLTCINQRLYQPLLERVLKHRYASLVVLLTVAIGGITLMAKGWIRTVFFPEVPGQIIQVQMRMKSGGPLNLTMQNITRIEEAAEAINQEAMAELQTDQPPIARLMTAMTDPLNAYILAELQPEKQRRLETMTTLHRWRERVGTLEGIEELTFKGSFETGGGFIIELGARDEAVLHQAVTEFMTRLAQVEGFHDIRSDLHQGHPQIRLHLKPEAQHLGLTTADLATQIGNAFGGLEVQRVQRAADEVKIIVRYLADRRRTMRDLLDTRIQTQQGQWVPLSLVASLETGYVPHALNRQNGRRVVQVRASLDRDLRSPSQTFAWIQAEVTPDLQKRYPELTVTGAGELEEIGHMRGGLKRALLMILILIYALLAVPLKSYWQPFVIMSVIPFGFVGAALGHGISDRPLSVLSFFGMLAVTGVVVNDSLVMLTRFNEMRSQGTPLHQALVQAGGSRFRAIVLTTVTTVCGLMPLLSETSEQAQYLIPAALSLAWGELFATPITLFIVPLLAAIGNDLGIFLKPAKADVA